MNTRRTFRNARRTALGVVAVVAGAMPATTATAADRLLLFGGEVADAAYYSFVGTVLPLGASVDGRGWYQRYWVDAFGYEYDGGPGRVQADAYGLEAALGYGGSDELGWWSVSLGLRHTDTSLAPDDTGANARGSQLGGKFQVDFERRLADQWRVGGIASYTSEQDGYWLRGRLLHGASTTRAFGLEAIANGNDEAEATAVGLVRTFEPGARGFAVGLKAGYRFQDDADGAYAGLEVGYSF